jgi:putative tryptophan/tyrosine transport system substrate-binding protein
MFAAATGQAQAQQSGKVYRIAFAHPTAPVADINQSSKGSLAIPAIFEELIRLGYVEGRNLLIERYSGEGRASHYADLARDVVSRNPDVIITFVNSLALDFKAATSTIPIVGSFGDPIKSGIVLSLARPGGNITGVSVDVGIDQWAKRSPTISTSCPSLWRARSQRRISNAISSSRPTSGVRCRWPARRPAPLARTIRYSVTGSGTPLSSWLPRSLATKSPAT